ncbi:cell envelope integrity protein CreD [Pseudoalteromonas sp. S983]|nr:cell envelope integrity protein CreD [Pseudoalteromonas sp. S983]
MGKINYESAKKEALFIALPFFVLLLLKVLQGDFIGFIKLSDFALATSILWGQLLAKTFDVPDKNKNKDKFSTKQVQIFIFSFLSLTLYIGLNFLNDISEIVYWAQLTWYGFSILYYIPISTLMSDLTKR